jgi:hypothetical protein
MRLDVRLNIPRGSSGGKWPSGRLTNRTGTPQTISQLIQFARQWKIAERPLIEDALARVPVENQLALLKRLLPLELEIGRANGDLPQASEYSEQLMAFGDAITDILRE